MKVYFFPGVLGLLLGLLLHWTGFSRATELRLALGLRRSWALRSGLTAVGWAMALTALLMWLAVIDVDTIEVLPLSLGALLGGGILGVAAGLSGFTPITAFAGLAGSPGGVGDALEALCVLAGCFAGTLLLPVLDGLFAPLQTAAPYAAATLFEVTLDEPWLLSGGFLGQGCAGLLLAVIALCIPSPKPVILTEEEVASKAEEAAVSEELPLPEDASAPEEVSVSENVSEDESPDTESAAEETFVALLEGEEPLVVDTEMPGEEEPAEDEEVSEEEGLK